MYYIVSYSTDMRNKQTKIKKTTSLKSAIKYASIDNGNFTYSDPEYSKNYHHTFNKIYEFYGRIDKKWINSQILGGSRTYPCSKEDAIHDFLYYYGKEYKIV